MQEEWFRTRGKHATDTKLRGVYCGSWLIGASPSLGARSQDAAALPAAAKKWTVHERALQTKFSRPSPNQPAMKTVIEGCCNNGTDGTDVTAAASGTQTHLAYPTNVVQLFPGDQCVLICAESNDEKVHAEGVN